MVNPNIILIHPNPTVKKNVNETLEKYDKITLTEPLEYDPFIYIRNTVDFFLFDSGGIQEEAPSLCKSVLVLRDKSARSEAIASGTARLLRTATSTIVNSVNLLKNVQDEYILMSRATNPFGDGTESIKIINFYPKSIND